MTTTIRQDDAARKRRRAVIAGGFGNVLENYDNVIYTYFAATLAKLFFPSSSDVASLLATFGVFAVGFLIRPLGALFFGHLGDKYGRRRALIVSVVLMAIATTAIGLLPTFAAIGVAAPVLLVLARLVQGFSVGGEWAGSAALLVEYAPEGKRGRYGSVQQVSTGLGFLLAAAVAAGVTLFFDPADITSWAWRLPFLLGLVTGVAALWLRLGLDETPAFKETAAEGETVANPLVTGLRTQRLAILKGFGFTVLWTLAYFLFLTYVPTFLTEVVGVPETTAKISNVVALVVFVALIPVTGALSDRVGRKPLLLTAAGGFVLLSIPVLLLLNTGQTALVILGQLIVAVLLACFSGPGPAAISELFPTEVRYSALSIGYNFSVMAFGGTAPFVATFLIDKTGWNIAPALLPTAAALITGAVVMSMKETAHKPLR